MSRKPLGPLQAVKAVYFWTVENSSGQRVANTLDAEYLLEEGVREFDDRSEEYANLFASAPEMLDQLEKAALQFRYYENAHREKGTEDSMRKALVNAGMAYDIEQIIAKAKGGA